MTRSSLPSILLGVLSLCAVGTVALVLLYAAGVKKLRTAQAQMNYVAEQQNLAHALEAEAQQYGKSHPDLDQAIRDAIQAASKAPATAPTKP